MSVGFGSAPAAAKLSAGDENVGVNTVVGGWAYQGSRAAYRQGSLFDAQGRYRNSVSSKDGGQQWQAEITGKNANEKTQLFGLTR